MFVKWKKWSEYELELDGWVSLGRQDEVKRTFQAQTSQECRARCVWQVEESVSLRRRAWETGWLWAESIDPYVPALTYWFDHFDRHQGRRFSSKSCKCPSWQVAQRGCTSQIHLRPHIPSTLLCCYLRYLRYHLPVESGSPPLHLCWGAWARRTKW